VKYGSLLGKMKKKLVDTGKKIFGKHNIDKKKLKRLKHTKLDLILKYREYSEE